MDTASTQFLRDVQTHMLLALWSYFRDEESEPTEGFSAIFNVVLTGMLLVAIFLDDISQKCYKTSFFLQIDNPLLWIFSVKKTYFFTLLLPLILCLSFPPRWGALFYAVHDFHFQNRDTNNNNNLFYQESKYIWYCYSNKLYKANTTPEKTSQKHSDFSRGNLWTEVKFRVFLCCDKHLRIGLGLGLTYVLVAYYKKWNTIVSKISGRHFFIL